HTLFSFIASCPTGICPLSLHDALPILVQESRALPFRERVQHDHHVRRAVPDTHGPQPRPQAGGRHLAARLEELLSEVAATCLGPDRKSTRLNSSHLVISYAVFCLKKKK